MIKLKALLKEALEKVDYPMIKLANGAYKEGSPDWTKFKVGGYYSDGDVHRYVLSQHPEFDDDDRITGTFQLVERRPEAMPESEFLTSGDKIEQLSKSSKPFPPIVVDSKGSIIDGGHRLEAAILRGDKMIKVFHQI
jgi:hypothetical protein